MLKMHAGYVQGASHPIPPYPTEILGHGRLSVMCDKLAEKWNEPSSATVKIPCPKKAHHIFTLLVGEKLCRVI